MDTSKFLSKVLGLYLLIIGVAMFVDMHQFTRYVYKLVNDAPLMFVTGFFTLILGLLMVVSHNVWELHWRLIITIIAWLTLFKGASIIFFPEFIDHLSLSFVHHLNFAYASASFDFLLGALLTYLGFKRS
ncbi:hypothetical protein [Legionella maioricensis]|uniref:Integral membrane protein (PIN domain superfamily) n=1 Tax=Legionella maioricensis TaxID=2896528 RepID=A0A9X2D1S6_9GAMM|nr:hypothetical protein [Legionella maioricensis]MCL9684841.1 hypothetical protein [Legionella maioricensis]MCL9688521.1 hypothetical protein [Legionella maioricensis]